MVIARHQITDPLQKNRLAADRSATKLRLGIIGAGYAAEMCHLPAARELADIEVAALADMNLTRASRVATRFGIATCTDDYRRILGAVEGIIVAVPNALHAQVAADILHSGTPVLVEKPLATTVSEGRRTIDIGKGMGVHLQVGLMYRFAQSSRLVKELVAAGWLGRINRFLLEYGAPPGWTGPGAWQREQAGGGILMDIGPHMLDLLLWWLGDALEVTYWDDRVDGLEAECRLALILGRPPNGVPGEVTLTRLRNLGIRARIEGERFTLEWRSVKFRLEVAIRPTGPHPAEATFVADFQKSDTFRRMFSEQLRAFGDVVRTGREPQVTGDDALASLRLIERCYQTRLPLRHSWL